MLAVLSTDKLTTISLKRRANSINSTLSLPFKPSSLTSSPSTFFIASSDTIYACNPSSLALTPIHTAASRISHLLATTDALVYTTNTTIHILSPARARAAQIIVSHDTPVTAIALSNNVSLIASVTSSEVHIHNIALKKTAPIVLRLPPSVPVTTALFHPHACTRLVLGAGTLLFVFDTAKPDDPPRCITVETGDIKAMSCSPFSKSLIALATSGGSVGLVDLDKEKPSVTSSRRRLR
jgi:protein NEDD1